MMKQEGDVRRTFIFCAIAVMAASVAAAQPSLPAGSVLNAASFARNQAVAPGSLVSIFGTNLGTGLSQADTVPLSTSMAGTSVTFNNIPAPLLFVSHADSGDQINAQIPWEVQGTSAQIVVTQGGRPSSPSTVQLTSAAPGIFSVNFGTGQAIAYSNSEGLIAAATGAIPGLNTKPAKINDPASLVILATGLGPVNPPVQTGANVTDGLLHQTVTTPEVLVGNVPAKVIFAGMTPQFVGVYQLNIIIAPGTPTGNAVPLQIRMGGFTSTDQVTIAVSN